VTVLVDRPLWEWRGRRWAHMVSDHSYAELHRFAQALGKRRLAFQGDHYDVDEGMRIAALAAGAEAVDSRQLVRGLRQAGLRRRDPWIVLEHASTTCAAATDTLQRLPLEHTLCSAAGAALAMLADPVELVVLQRVSETGVGVQGARLAEGADPVVVPHAGPEPGLEVHVWDGEAGDALIELVLAR
jgi:Protein of unknown function (DUF4031)